MVAGNGVNGWATNDIIDFKDFKTDISNSGKSFGLGYCSLTNNTIRLICAADGIGTMRKTGGTSSNTTVLMFNMV